MDIAFEYLVIGGALAILGLWLEQFEPPIKKQWIALILMVVGSVSAYYYVGNPSYGFLISGVVYYKKVLVAELCEILSSLNQIKESTTKEE